MSEEMYIGCRESYEFSIEALDTIIFRAPKPELIRYRNELLSAKPHYK